jgi:hypothetical protein
MAQAVEEAPLAALELNTKRRSGYRWYLRINVPADLRDTLFTLTI